MSHIPGIFLVLLICLPVSAQVNYSRVYTIEDGMPHTETTHVFVDSKGYIWASCGNSWITRFDGQTFRNFSPEEIGMSHYSYDFMEDQNGIWVWDISNHLARFWDDRWQKVPMPDSIISLIQHDKWGILGLNRDGKIYQLNSAEATWQFLSQIPIPSLKRPDITTMGFYQLSTRLILYIGFKNWRQGYWEVINPFKGEVALVEEQKRIMFLGSDYRYYQDPDRNIFVQQDGSIPRKIFSGNGYFQALSNNLQEGYWVQMDHPVLNKRAICLLDGSGIKSTNAFLDRPVTTMTVDKLGYYWFSSQTGLVRVTPWELLFLEDQPGMIPNLHCIGEDPQGHIWMGGYRQGMVRYNGQQLTPLKTEGRELRFLPGSYCAPTGEVYFFTENHGLIYLNEGGWHNVPLWDKLVDNHLTGYFIEPLRSGLLGLGTTRHGLGLLAQPWKTGENIRLIGKDKGILLNNVLCLKEDLRGRIWCGRHSQGLALYDPQRDTAFTWLINKFPDPGIGAMSLELDESGNLWLGTNKGIYFLKDPHLFDPISDSLFEKIQPVSISEAGNSLVTAMKSYKQWLIFSNLKGHGFIDLPSYYNDPAHPRVLFTDTSHPERGGSGEQNTLLIDRQELMLIGKDRGAVCLDLKHLPLEPPVVTMRDPIFLLDGQELSIQDDRIQLPMNKRSLRVMLQTAFNGITDRTAQFQYRLSGMGIPKAGFTTLDREPVIYFDYLPPGVYQLEIQMIRHNQMSDSRMVKIDVPGTLSEKPLFWFGTIGTLSFLAGAGLYFRRRAELVRKQAALDRAQWIQKLQQTQISAITSSLNPHFINNSLNWLQYKVKDDPEAVAVVGRLSENIRTVFRHSRAGQPDHTLEEELRLVDNYLLIQGVRYNRKIEVSLPDLTAQPELGRIRVPLMQLLIHVENAVEHGLRNSKSAHRLKVSAYDEKDFLYLKVEDDGVGRIRARNMHSHGTQQGTKMLKELHQILNQKNKKKIKSWYEDTPLTDPETGEGMVPLFTYEYRKILTMGTTALSFFIVEDEPLAQHMMREALESLPGNRVCGVATDVETAYEGILREVPDAVFLDIKLEGGDAFELLERFKQNSVDFPPVILMTAYTEFEFAQKALNDYRHKIIKILQKPFMEGFEDTFADCRAAILAFRQTSQHRTVSSQLPLFVKQGSITYRLEWKDIDYIEVGGSGSIILVTRNRGNLQILQTLTSFLETAPSDILRIHRNNAVNIERISHIDHEERLLYLRDHSRGLSIGRTYYPAVVNLMH